MNNKRNGSEGGGAAFARKYFISVDYNAAQYQNIAYAGGYRTFDYCDRPANITATMLPSALRMIGDMHDTLCYIAGCPADDPILDPLPVLHAKWAKEEALRVAHPGLADAWETYNTMLALVSRQTE